MQGLKPENVSLLDEFDEHMMRMRQEYFPALFADKFFSEALALIACSAWIRAFRAMRS